MNGDVYCEYCQDNKYIETSEGKWISCPNCNHKQKDKKDDFDKFNWED